MLEFDKEEETYERQPMSIHLVISEGKDCFSRSDFMGSNTSLLELVKSQHLTIAVIESKVSLGLGEA